MSLSFDNFDFLPIYKAYSQVHEPTPLIIQIIAVIILKFEQHGFTVQ